MTDLSHTGYRELALMFTFIDEGAVVYVICAIEANLGIICACLPILKPIFATFLPSVFGTSFTSSYQINTIVSQSDQPSTIRSYGNGPGLEKQEADVSIAFDQ